SLLSCLCRPPRAALFPYTTLFRSQGDEGHAEEPDHVVAMLEFCSLLCHLERQALTNGQATDSYQRALRDFITRYLGPLLDAISSRLADERDQELDPTLAYLVAALPDWVADHLDELSAQVGPCPEPGTASNLSVADTRPMWD